MFEAHQIVGKSKNVVTILQTKNRTFRGKERSIIICLHYKKQVIMETDAGACMNNHQIEVDGALEEEIRMIKLVIGGHRS